MPLGFWFRLSKNSDRSPDSSIAQYTLTPWKPGLERRFFRFFDERNANMKSERPRGYGGIDVASLRTTGRATGAVGFSLSSRERFDSLKKKGLDKEIGVMVFGFC